MTTAAPSDEDRLAGMADAFAHEVASMHPATKALKAKAKGHFMHAGKQALRGGRGARRPGSIRKAVAS